MDGWDVLYFKSNICGLILKSDHWGTRELSKETLGLNNLVRFAVQSLLLSIHETVTLDNEYSAQLKHLATQKIKCHQL